MYQVGKCVIALDQALENTGVAVFDGKAIYTTVFTTKPKESSSLRLHRIDSFLCSLLTTLQPQHIVLEESYPGRFRNSAMRLAQVFCTVTNACYRHQVPTTILHASAKQPNSWPAVLGIKGTKEYCKNWLLEIHPQKQDIEELEEHEYDAIGILWAKMVGYKAFSSEEIASIPIIRVSKYALLDLQPQSNNLLH